MCPKEPLRYGSSAQGSAFVKPWRLQLKPARDITDPRLVKALAHPLRVRILGLLEDQVASPSELAQKLHAPLGNVSYHVRILASLNLIRLVSETPRRGSVEHHYTAVAMPVISDEAWSNVPDIVKNAMVAAALEQAGATISAAATAGGFNRPEAHLSRVQLLLDSEGWHAMAEETRRWMERVDEIGREAAERLGDGPGRGDHATMVTMFFESPPGDEDGSGAEDMEHRRSPDASQQRSTAA
jgi:DNA-binding transcriptional ArsR family regulator